MHMKEIRVLVFEKNQTQVKARKKVYPYTIISFCLIYIRKNDSDIIHLFDEMQYDI